MSDPGADQTARHHKLDDAVFAVVGQLCSDDRLIRLGLLHISLTLSMSAVKLVDRTTASLQA